MISTATISACGNFRYDLIRIWDERLPRLAFLMFNPSKADAIIDDHTVTKCIGLAARWGYGSIVIVNLYAYRSTNPKAIKGGYQVKCDVVGPDNLATLERVGREATDVVCAWGCESVTRRIPGFREHADLCVRLVARNGAQAIGPRTKTGCPRHPLTVPYSSPRIPYEAQP